MTMIGSFRFLNSLSRPLFFQPNRYGIDELKSEKIFKNIENQFSYLIQKDDLNKDGLYNEIDIKIFNEWTNSEFKLLNSQLLFQQSNQTKEELKLILSTINDSEKKVTKSNPKKKSDDKKIANTESEVLTKNEKTTVEVKSDKDEEIKTKNKNKPDSNTETIKKSESLIKKEELKSQDKSEKKEK